MVWWLITAVKSYMKLATDVSSLQVKVTFGIPTAVYYLFTHLLMDSGTRMEHLNPTYFSCLMGWVANAIYVCFE